MPKTRSNRGPRFCLFMKGLVGLVILLLAAESASAYTSVAITKDNTIALAGSVSLTSPLRAGFVEPYTESSSEMVSAGEVIELAQYGSVRRVSRRTARRTSRRN